MGACSFVNKGRGKSMRDVYTDLVDEATSEYGHDSYNGTISTTCGYQDITNEWKASKEDIRTFISKKLEKASKRDCFGVCIAPPKVNSNKIKSQVEHFVEKGTKKWVLKYVVSDYDNQIGKYSTKGEAVKAARAYTEKTQQSTSIVIEKKLERGNSTVAKITYKPSSTEKDGQYIFFGWAAE